MMKLNKLLLFFSITFFVCACSGNGNDPPLDDNHNRQAILTHWVDNIIEPSYANFELAFDAMVAKSDAFSVSPSAAALVEFRTAWANAYASWQTVELFEFGPADRNTLRSFFNIYPADVAGITENIGNLSSNLEVPGAYPRQGFPALDYLINGTGETDEEIVAYFTAATDGPKRLAYLQRIIARMNMLLDNVTGEWNNSYRTTFINDTDLDIGSSMGSVVNAYVLHFERFIRSGKIGIPSGASVASAGVAHPEKTEAFYRNEISLLLAKNAFGAVRNFFNGVSIADGGPGPSFKSYLDALGAKDAASGTLLSDIINAQFQTIETKLNQLSPSLVEQIGTNNDAMVDVHTEMQKLVRMLKVDMSSAMSITITYTDNDGD